MKTKEELQRRYSEKGLKSVLAIAKRNNWIISKYEFGYDNELNQQRKKDWIENGKFYDSVLRYHYYSRSISNRHNGYKINILRGIEIIIKNNENN